MTNEEWLEHLAHNDIPGLRAWFKAEHVETVDMLVKERDNLAKDLEKANKQREEYREKFGKCLDYADAIHALMDEGLA